MDPRYPIGKFTWSGSSTAEERSRFIEDIAVTPQHMRNAVAGLNSTQLDTPYRDGGWTIRQVVNHMPDSHMNSYIRFKFALTEHEPTIKPYDEAVWVPQFVLLGGEQDVEDVVSAVRKVISNREALRSSGRDLAGTKAMSRAERTWRVLRSQSWRRRP